MRILAYYWGIAGVILSISSAVFKLSPRVFELQYYALDWWHWLAMIIFVPYMLYAEGYKGFYLNLAPRVVARAVHLRANGNFLTMLLAPFFCMGYIMATRKRMLVSWGVTSAIVLLVMLVKHIPQPWRGVIDAGVVGGLGMGVGAIALRWLQHDLHGKAPDYPIDLP